MDEHASQSMLERHVTRMQFQLAVYTDIFVDRVGDDIAMGARFMLLDEVSLNALPLLRLQLLMSHDHLPLGIAYNSWCTVHFPET